MSQYFDCVDIIRDLIKAGAKPASAIIGLPNMGYWSLSPPAWDAEWLELCEDEIQDFNAAKQPFWDGHWSLLYENWER